MGLQSKGMIDGLLSERRGKASVDSIGYSVKVGLVKPGLRPLVSLTVGTTLVRRYTTAPGRYSLAALSACP
jgi:hypothetical protein